MSVPPRFSGQVLPSNPGKVDSQPHTIELFLDYVCPFSAKMFKVFYTEVAPIIQSKYKKPGVAVVFRQQIQPWHPSSTLVHEAGAAVLKVAPEKFWEFSQKLFEQQKHYFDVSVVNETRNNTYKRLAKLAGSIDGIDESKIYDLLVVSDKPDKDGGLNSGNKVTDDVKYMVKANRLTGVHVTPTVLFDGTVENSISSSWSKDQWTEWLEKSAK